MGHEHVTVTLDADTVEHIQAVLREGETVEARVRALVEREYGRGRPRGVEFVDDCSI